ncbi:MAG: NAD(P)-dependent glycerol-3-phosphate dehydrogenase, partial [Deltaproteobacteria bacterium]|nr:NAD(P)-dependent glycerol-3-phosphate dehydrogenase [Deltaproteobacteria bacterium]
MRVTVLGAGSWGTALGVQLHRNGHRVSMWEFFPDLARDIIEHRENRRMLPGVMIPDEVTVTNDPAEGLDGAEMVLFVVPTVAVRSTAELIAPHLDPTALVVNAAKGIEKGSGARISTILTEELPGEQAGRTVTFSGPSHAEEVSRGIPTTIVAACPDLARAEVVQEVFSSASLRVYTNSDQIGVELAGSLKNVIAVAAGVLDGLGFGDNTKGALLTRGLAEISRLGAVLGAD